MRRLRRDREEWSVSIVRSVGKGGDQGLEEIVEVGGQGGEIARELVTISVRIAFSYNTRFVLTISVLPDER